VPFFADDVATDKDQRIVVSGVGGEEGGDEIDFAAARYLGDIEPNPSPPPDDSPSLTGSTASPASTRSPGPDTHAEAPSTKLSKATIKGRSRVATFTFSAPGDAHATFRCKLDKGPFKPCRSPKTYRNLKPGRHVFRVQARDALGQADTTPAIKRFRIPKS